MAVGRTLRLLTAVVLAAAVLAALAGPVADSDAQAPARPGVGVQFHGMWSDYTDAQREQVLTRLVEARVGWVRLDLSWAMLQPRGRGSYDLTWGVPFADRVIDMVHRHGLHLLVTFWLTPGWANGGRDQHVLPTLVADYAQAARWAAKRWAGKVNAWEVWNEPNQNDYMAGADPGAYARLLRAAYPAIHAGDVNTTVVFGGPSENDVPWIRNAYAAGVRGSFDVMATHPYLQPSNHAPETPDDGTIYTLTHVAQVHRLMQQYGDGAKRIWFTEFGWSSHANTATTPKWELGVTETRQGDFYVRTLKLLASSYPYVANTFWYTERNQHDASTAHIDNFGLLHHDLTPKPAYQALRRYLLAT